jgi:hypothetical protein
MLFLIQTFSLTNCFKILQCHPLVKGNLSCVICLQFNTQFITANLNRFENHREIISDDEMNSWSHWQQQRIIRDRSLKINKFWLHPLSYLFFIFVFSQIWSIFGWYSTIFYGYNYIIDLINFTKHIRIKLEYD